MKKDIPEIVKRNLDTEHIMHASCKYGYHYAGEKNSHKLFSLLIGADFHHDQKRLESSVRFLNFYECLDCAINLGDTMAENFAEDDGKWYLQIISESKKPYLAVIGNHDMGNSNLVSISANGPAAYERFIKPCEKSLGFCTEGRAYYVKYFEKYKVALVVLNNYDFPDETEDGEHYKIHRGAKVFSEEQLNWLINVLNKIPTDYTLIVSFHALPFPATPLETPFTQDELTETASGNTAYEGDNLLCEIINAWVSGGNAALSCFPKKKYEGMLPDINIKADFTKRGKGLFACYLMGHIHEDIILKCDKYPYQTVIAHPSSSADTWQNYCSDLPRAEGTKAEDCLTVLSLDSKKREIRLVRIGSDFTMEMKERRYFVINY